MVGKALQWINKLDHKYKNFTYIMKKTLFSIILSCIGLLTHAQILSISFNQNGYMFYGEANVESNVYVLFAPDGSKCGFSASFSVIGENTIMMYAYNPTLYGYVPATYYLYENGACEISSQGYTYIGSWNIKSENISFKRSGNCTPPNSSTDGYIYQGVSIKVNGTYYKLYKKNGYKYIYDCKDGWCRLKD